jgi:predicted permease
VAYVTAFLRLLLCPLVVVAALYPFRAQLDREMMLALVIPASAPVAAMVTMFASKYRRDVDMSVGIVCGTTILSILTMPAIIALAMEILK